MTTTIDLRGRTFGRLTPIEKTPPRKGRSMWLCLCECGNKTTVRAEHMKDGRSTSCGCFSKESHRTHGHTAKEVSPEYRSWQGMKDRCLNTKSPSFPDYGGRGITVCDRWVNSFENFFADMGRRLKDKSIDRKDNDGNYEPGNCRWATHHEQVYNRRNSLFATINWVRKPVKEWCKINSINYNVAIRRIRRGVPPKLAVTVKGHGLRTLYLTD